MGINTDSKTSMSGSRPGIGSSLQPTTSSQSKAAEAGGVQHHQNIMATIADDDDRLLARIGYTPVGIP
jgi:hypothetical protein